MKQLTIYLKNSTNLIVSRMEEIQALIEKEIDRRVQEKLTTFIELVSKTYDISMKVLLRDLSKQSSGNTEAVGCGPICMGVTANGKRCKFGATTHGYCKKHLSQRKPQPSPTSTPVVCQMVNEHNHTIPPLFCSTCPVCVKSREQTPKEKLLIDM